MYFEPGNFRAMKNCVTKVQQDEKHLKRWIRRYHYHCHKKDVTFFVVQTESFVGDHDQYHFNS